MKALAALIFGTIGFVLSIPLVFANGGDSTGVYACGQLGTILDTIRTLESGGNYQIESGGSSASGAYQYIDTTWRYWAGEADVSTDLYPTAASAPDFIQDQVAGVNVSAILADNDNSVEAVPIVWYYPAALDDPSWMDRIPAPSAGNTLTVREYQTRWLDTYNEKAEAGGENAITCGPTAVTGDWALPAPREVIGENTLDDPHHDYPAWDFMIPAGTPIYAITGGTVANVGTWTGNWWAAGCGGNNPPAACTSCGVGITIQHPDGLRHTYCHNSTSHVAEGDAVAPGQHIADSGNSGRSGSAHLHLELRINGIRHCPQPLLDALYHGTAIPLAADLPTSGCSFQT
ncbi:M23 family metallopeptidase [Ilumatobacter sp.]|uniref:M23 family metallopeptidase n=1 Tax=Ilumatobacter sp. TaxID=1967498 RepID=UPI00329701FC